jgi:hypothetical protein
MIAMIFGRHPKLVSKAEDQKTTGNHWAKNYQSHYFPE